MTEHDMPQIESRREDPTFAPRRGALLRRLASDIKRRPDALAAETGIDLNTINAIFNGEAPPQEVETLVSLMVSLYPLSRLDLEVVMDDTDEGVVVMHATDAKKTARFFNKENRNKEYTPFYEYRDSAMSALGPFKPEWIAVLRHVEDADPQNPDVIYNKGHFLHQGTFYVGDINLYWIDGKGQYQVAQLDTGDSSYKTPFVPHTFAKRSADQDAYIMAVTYASGLQVPTQRDLSIVNPDKVSHALVDLTSRETAFRDTLRLRMNESLIPSYVLQQQSGITSHKLNAFLKGEILPEEFELGSLAIALGINERDLMPPNPVATDEVVIKRQNESPKWLYPNKKTPAYLIRPLAGSIKVANTKSFALTANLPSDAPVMADEFDLTTPMHTYGYNYGTKPAMLHWEGKNGTRQEVIEPEASFYAKPLLGYALRTDGTTADMMIVRIGVDLAGDALWEISSLPRQALNRLLKETGTWY